MRNFIKRLFIVLILTFIVGLFLISYPFFAIIYVLTGKDITAQLDRFVN
jgi:hypothetical protein